MKTDNEKWSYLIEMTQKLLRVSDAGDDERINKLLDLLWRYLIELEKIKDSGTATGYLLSERQASG